MRIDRELWSLIVSAGLILAAGNGWAADHSQDVRHHWRLTPRQASRLQVTLKDMVALGESLPRGTTITRLHSSKPPRTGDAPGAGIEQSETLVLVDVGVEGWRFIYRSFSDYRSGRDHYSLNAWRGDRQMLRLEFLHRTGIQGRDLAEYLEKARERGFDEIDPVHMDLDVVTIDLGPERVEMTFGEWRDGTMSEVSRERLEGVWDEGSRLALKIVDAFSTHLPEIGLLACPMLIQPLLRPGEPESCEVSGEEFRLRKQQPDCRFDRWFGEPCTLAQESAWRLRTEPDLVPES